MHTRRSLNLLVALALLLAAVLAGPPAMAGAASTTPAPQPTTPAPTSTVAVPLPSPDIIPEPNSGHAPRDSGERGGAQQTLLFLLVCAGMLTVFGLAWRESRRKRRVQAHALS